MGQRPTPRKKFRRHKISTLQAAWTFDRTQIIDQKDDRDILVLFAKDEFTLRFANQSYARAAGVKLLVMNRGEAATPDSPATVEPVELDSSAISWENRDRDHALAKWEETRFLVEFKEIEEVDFRKIAWIEIRLKSLVPILQITHKPANYRVLDCKAYFKIDATATKPLGYGWVFSLPGSFGSDPDCRVDNLQSLRKKEDNKVPVHYPLGARFRLAALLAGSISELHAAKWLHHDITSHNFVCLTSSSSPSIDGPYLCSFGFALVDDPHEVLEITSRTDGNNYRHPDYQLPLSAGKVTRYRRSYEMYSLGILLIEIGLWKRIEAFRPINCHAAAFTKHLKDMAVPMLAYYMGTGYAEAVSCCLDPTRFGVGGDEERRLSEAFSEGVVAVLEACQA